MSRNAISLSTLRRIPSLFSLAIVLSSISCHDAGVEVVKPDEGGVGIILPGIGIEGIALGNSEETVAQKLGKPSAKGWADGLYRGWRTYAYWEGQHAGLEIYFIDNGDSYGPADVLTVLSPYGGKTSEGIGLGSSLETVHQKYGKPKHTLTQPTQHWIADFYCFNGKKLEVHYVDSLVSTMSIGYFVPMDEDTLSSCR